MHLHDVTVFTNWHVCSLDGDDISIIFKNLNFETFKNVEKCQKPQKCCCCVNEYLHNKTHKFPVFSLKQCGIKALLNALLKSWQHN